MDVRQRTFNEIAILGKVMGTNNIAVIQQTIGLPPLIMHNVMVQAEKDGKIKYNRKKAIFKLDKDVELQSLSISNSSTTIMEELELFVEDANSRESDITIDELQYALGMSTDVLIRMLAYRSPKLTTYDLSPDNDKQSVYTFVTLKGNEGNEWGKKQLERSKQLISGTKVGGLKAQETMIKKLGGVENYNKWRSEISAKGGSVLVPKGFATNPELARTAGAKGGSISRRGKVKR